MNETTQQGPIVKKVSALSICSLSQGIIGLLSIISFVIIYNFSKHFRHLEFALGHICIFTLLLSISTVIFGRIAISRIKRNTPALTGRGLAITGLICGYVTVACFPIEALVSDNAHRRVKASMLNCRSNLRYIATGMMEYANKNDEKYPDKLSELYPNYVGIIKVFFYNDEKSEIVTPENIDKYGCFEIVSGLSQSFGPDTLFAYEKSTNHWLSQGRHELFVDGHVEWNPMKE